MLVAGLDEAGRGCVIGPMAIAGVLFDRDGLAELAEIGVRDSKALSPSKREELAVRIRGLALACKVILVQPCEIDLAVATCGLNKLEAKIMACIIDELGPDLAYVDSSDILAPRFASTIRSYMRSGRPVEIVAEHEADTRYPVVAAASIIAKVERDRALRRLKEEVGVDFGSGYPGDPRTLRFLRDWYAKHRSYPDFVRKSWKTAREIAAEVGTARLDEWCQK